MSEPNSQGEPTMEEILASIRKIISEDGPEGEAPEEAQAEEAQGDEAQAEAAPADEEPAAPDSDEEVLDLMQEVKDDGTVVDLSAERAQAEAEPEPEPEPEPETAPEPESKAAEAELELAESEPEPEPEAEPLPEPPPPAPAVPAEDETLLSSDTKQAATSSLMDLAGAAGLGAAAQQTGIGSGRTLETLVLEALRPYLKGWLDENLAPLVERIVREEIQKMVKRAEYR